MPVWNQEDQYASISSFHAEGNASVAYKDEII